MRATQPVEARRTAIAGTCSECDARFTMPQALLALFDWLVASRRSRNVQRILLVVSVLVAALLIATYLILGLLPGETLILLACWPFDDRIWFRI